MKPDSKFSKHQYVRDEFDTQYFRESIPIESVAEVLGIDVNRNGFFLCPTHPDSNPSAQIRPKTNRWCCYTCADKAKTTIDLVMAVEGLSFTQAVYFLEEHFPGGITRKGGSIQNELTPPYFPPELWKEIGLSRNPYSSKNITGIVNEEDGRYVKEQKQLSLSYRDATELVLDKINEYNNFQRKYCEKVLRDFPELDSNSVAYVKKQQRTRLKRCLVMQTTLENFFLLWMKKLHRNLRGKKKGELK